MRTTSKWIRLLLTIGALFSCVMLAMSIFFIYFEFRKLGVVPIRFYIIVPTCLLIMVLVVYFSEKQPWLMALRLMLVTFMCMSIMACMFGLRVVLNILLGEPTSVSIYQGVMVFSIGTFIFWLLLKLSNSKLLT